MSNEFQKKGAGLLASVFIALIILSFMFTGYQQGMGPSSPDAIGDVDGTPIKITEYQQAYQQQMDFFEKVKGSRPTTQEIKQYGIEDRIISGLVEKKLMMNLANALHMAAAPSEVIQTIQGIPAFQQNGQFNVEQYKQVLRYHSIAPNQFEQELADSAKLTRLSALLNYVPVSDNYMKASQKLQEGGVSLTGVQLRRDLLVKHVVVPAEAVTKFIENGENKVKLESYFQTQKGRFDRPATITASHILVRITPERTEEAALKAIEEIKKTLTPQNFAQVAEEKSEDPSAKGKGGSLGTFTPGRMVPEFDKAAVSTPVGTISDPIKTNYGYHLILVQNRTQAFEAKLADHLQDLARELLQKGDKAAQSKLEKDLLGKVKMALEKQDMATLKELQKTYNFVFVENLHVAPLDDQTGPLQLLKDNLDKIITEASSLTAPKLYAFDQIENNVLLLAQKYVSKTGEQTAETASLEQQKEETQRQFVTSLNQDLLQQLKEKAKVKIYKKMLE